MKHRSTNMVAASILAIVGVLALGYQPAYSQKATEEVTENRAAALVDNTGKGSRAIEGTWMVTVTIRNCDTGAAIATFKAMDLFIQGGSVVDTNAAPPATRGPGLGSWESAGDHSFSSTLRFFLYNPDGTFAGVRRIAQNISLGDDNNSWESTVGITVFNPAGDQVATACGTAVAVRAQ